MKVRLSEIDLNYDSVQGRGEQLINNKMFMVFQRGRAFFDFHAHKGAVPTGNNEVRRRPAIEAEGNVAVILGLFALSVFMPVPTASAAEANYGYVDVARVFDEYEKTKENDQQLQEEGLEKEKERERKLQEIRALKDELMLLSDDAKTKKQEALDEKVRMLQDFDRDAKRELAAKRNKLIREIFQDIDEVIKRFGERKGFDYIFNERALVYSDSKYDMTDEIIKELNKK